MKKSMKKMLNDDHKDIKKFVEKNNDMDHQKNIDIKRKRIAKVALGMLDGSVNYLQGAIELEALRHEVGIYENDPDFVAFVAVLSEIDSLPIDISANNWSEEVQLRYKSEIKESVEWAKQFSLSACQSIAARYSVQ